jgi:hypothetical protein
MARLEFGGALTAGESEAIRHGSSPAVQPEKDIQQSDEHIEQARE